MSAKLLLSMNPEEREKYKNRKKFNNKKIFIIAASSVVFVFLIILATLLFSHSNDIVGVWFDIDDPGYTYEFAKNGAILISNEGLNYSGKYTINGDTLEMQFADKTSTCIFSVNRDGTLSITNESGETSTLQKSTAVEG